MRKYQQIILLLALLCSLTGCSQETEELETQAQETAETTSLTDTEAEAILTELIEKANQANYISAGYYETTWHWSDLSGDLDDVVLVDRIGAESVTDIENYFYAVFTEETAEKYLFPITTGVTIQEQTLPLYVDGTSGLTLEKRALADPLLLGEWWTDDIAIVSVTKDSIYATATYSYAYAPEEIHTGELRAIWDETSASWKLDDSYGLSFVGNTTYEVVTTDTDPVVEEILDTVAMAEVFLTQNFYENTDKEYMDFFTIEDNGEKTLNLEVLLAEKPELGGMLLSADPLQAIEECISSSLTPAFAAKFSIEDRYSYDADSGKLYAGEMTMNTFLGAIRGRYTVASATDDSIVLLTCDYEPGEDEAYYRYVYIVKHDGQWKITESVMLNPIMHVPDLYVSGS